ncbi:MAG: hypothetical protein Q9209_000931 [Squamulea sp. 1 TL-2023]
MLGRKRSLRSRRQPVAQHEELDAIPADHARAASPPALPQVSRGHLKSKLRPVETSYDRSTYPQTSSQDIASGPHLPSGGSYPPEIMIGLALGSPGKSPLPSLPLEDSTSWIGKNSEPQNNTTLRPGVQEDLCSRASRWKAFGGFFGKKSGLAQAPSTSSTYHLEHRHNSIKVHGTHYPYQSPPSSAQSELQGPSTAHAVTGPPRDWIGPGQLPSAPERESNTLRKRSSLRRNHFARRQAKDMKDFGASNMRQLTSHREGSPAPPPKDPPLGNNARQSRAKGSLLQVDIPNIELERYSVMFSSLLQPCQPPSTTRQPSPKRQPSLLARRQGCLQELHTATVPAFEQPWVHRDRSSGPQAASPNKSPSFSLFPPSPGASGPKYRNLSRERSPLHRSATTLESISPTKAKFDFSSSGAASPSKANFDFPTSTDQTDVIVIVHTPTEQQPKPRQPSRNESFLTTSDAQSFTTARGSPAPEQQSRPPPPPARHTSPRLPSPARNISKNRLIPRDHSPRRPSPARSFSANPLREAAEISIARQISISQRQRQLLVQAVPRVAPQPLQPQIVGKGHEARKSHHSHHLVLEDA